MHQTEWLRPEFPAAWGDATEASPLLTYFYVRPGISAFEGTNALAAPSSEIAQYTGSTTDQGHRLAYKPDPSYSGEFSFFFLSIHGPTGEISISDIGVVHFDRAIDGPVADLTCNWDDYVPSEPLPRNLTTGHVWVCKAMGDDANDGMSKMSAVATLTRGIEILRNYQPAGAPLAEKVMIIRGGVYRYSDSTLNQIDLRNYDGSTQTPIVIAGYAGEEVILDGFCKDWNQMTAAEKLNPYSGEWYGVDLVGSNHVVVENLTLRGWRVEAVNPDNTDHVQLRFLEMHNMGKWGVQAFGSVTNFVIEGCRISGVDLEHGIYIAGNGMDPAGQYLPGSHDIRISFNDVSYTNRHGIHVNGLQNQVLINNNRVQQAKYGGIQCTGTSNLRIWNNVLAESMRFGVSIFSDWDDTQWSDRESGSTDDWKATHYQVIRDIEIAYNTVYVPDAEWTAREGTSGPDEYEVIRFAETSQYTLLQESPNFSTDPTMNLDYRDEALVEPFCDIRVHDNVLVGQSERVVGVQLSAKKAVPFQPFVASNEFSREERMLEGIQFENNLIRAEQPFNGMPVRMSLLSTWEPNNIPAKSFDLADLQSSFPSTWEGNKLGGDPSFEATMLITPVSIPIWWPSRYGALDAADYSLMVGSDAIDRAEGPTLGVDAVGQERPLGVANDQGAIESH